MPCDAMYSLTCRMENVPKWNTLAARTASASPSSTPSATNLDAVSVIGSGEARQVQRVTAEDMKVRAAIARHIRTMADEGLVIPSLESLQMSGVAWDWMKPCYHQTLTYNCITDNEE